MHPPRQQRKTHWEKTVAATAMKNDMKIFQQTKKM